MTQSEQQVPEQSEVHVALEADWSAVGSLPVLPANAFLTQLGTPTPGGRPDGVYLIAGHLAPPVLIGSPGNIQASLDALGGQLAVDVYARLFLSRERAEELIKLLQDSLLKLDVQAETSK